MLNRYDFVLLVDVKDGNPNGDPDAGNMPRIDAETGQGLITDVCLKRKIRNYVNMVKKDKEKEKNACYDIYIQEKVALNSLHEKAYKSIGKEEKLSKKVSITQEDINEARDWLCEHFYDIRTFGAVMATGVNCGQVRGPVQLTFARSVDSVEPQEYTITRCAITKQKDPEQQNGVNRTIGRKSNIPYGLYLAHGFVSAFLAEQTGFSDDDLSLLWQALTNMFEFDRSAARGEMCTRGLYVFKHDSKLGNAPAHKLFELIHVETRIA